jgi:hypothetical protein
MKKVVFVLMTLVAGFMTACQQDAVAPDETIAIDQLTLSAARFAIEADPVTQTRCKGKLTEVAVAELPTSVTAYISENYPSATTLYAGKDTEGKIVVAVQKEDGTHVGVLFDANGAFVQELQRHGKRAKLTEVAVSDLLPAITADISTRYSGAEIKHAGTNSEGNFFVHLVIGATNKVAVYDANGVFVQEVDKPMHGGKKHKKR